MKTLFDKLYHFSTYFAALCGLLLTALLFVSAFLTTAYVTNMISQKVRFRFDNPFYNLVGIGVFLLCFAAVWRVLATDPARRIRILLGFVLVWCFVWGCLILVLGKTVPAADSMIVFAMAERLAGGDASAIGYSDFYISYYPHQIGLAACYELIIRLWQLLPFSLRAYPLIQLLNVALACVIVWYQYRSVHLLWKSERSDCLYLLLAGANLPLLVYTSFVYGEIPSFAAISIGLYHLLWLLNGNGAGSRRLNLYHSAVCLLALTFSVLLRKNSLIILIAVVIVTLLHGLRERRPLLPVLALLCVLCSLSILPLLESIYEHRSGEEIASGVPAMSYFAMGMQEASRAEGWYNGFNFNTYRDTGLDTEMTTLLSRKAIRERLAVFRADPGYALHFYRNKFLSQWTDGSYACRQAVYAAADDRLPLVESIYAGSRSSYLIAYCNAYQNVLYLGALLFCVFGLRTLRRDRTSVRLAAYLGLIGVLGGFLFHMLWEANGRYIFPYGLLLIPYAARGIDGLFGVPGTGSPKSRHLWPVIVLCSATVAVCISLSDSRNAKAKREQLALLADAHYDSMVCSMQIPCGYDPDDLSLYLGLSPVIVSEPAEDYRDLVDYLDAAFASGNVLTDVFLEPDPYTLWQNSQDGEAEVLSYFESYPDTMFHIFLPNHPLSYWLALSEADTLSALEQYLVLSQTWAQYPNVTLSFLGNERWLIANPDNYTDARTLTDEAARKVFLLHISSGRKDAAAMEEAIRELSVLIAGERMTPTEYPELGSCDIVFFGDSIIGNYTGPLSIPGAVTSFSHARTYNCARGGVPASESTEKALSFPTMVDIFLGQEPDRLEDAEVFRASLLRFIADDHTDQTLIFVINYGLNDYFDGAPVSDPGEPDNPATYSGALRTGIRMLQNAWPDSRIVLCTPTFTYYFQNGTEKKSENSGVLTDYVDAAAGLAKELDLLCMNNYEDLGIRAENGSYYLEDECHLNERGRLLYARRLMSELKQLLQ